MIGILIDELPPDITALRWIRMEIRLPGQSTRWSIATQSSRRHIF
jgi:hypothetical protein